MRWNELQFRSRTTLVLRSRLHRRRLEYLRGSRTLRRDGIGIQSGGGVAVDMCLCG